MNAWWWYQCLRHQPTRGQDVVGATAPESVTVSIQVWMVFLINFEFSYSLSFGAQGRYLSLMAELTIKSSFPASPPLLSEAGSLTPHLPTSSVLTRCWAPVRTQHRFCTSSAVFPTCPLFNVLCSYPETPESSGTSHQIPVCLC